MDPKSPLALAKKRSYSAVVLRGAGLCVNFLMTTFVARQLGVGEFGLLGSILAALAVLSNCLPMGWTLGIQTFVTRYTEKAQPALLQGVIARSQHVTVAISVLTAVTLSQLANPFIEEHTTLSLVLTGVAFLLPAYSFSALQQQILIGLQDVKWALFPLELLVPVTILLGLAVHPGADLGTVLAFHLLGVMLASLLQGLRMRQGLRRYEPTREFTTREWHRTTMPLVGGNMSQLLMTRGDVLLLAGVASMDAVGVYALGRRVVSLTSFVNMTLAAALAPMIGSAVVGRRFREAKQMLRQAVLWSGLWSLPFALAFFCAPGLILSFFGPEYVSGANVLRILSLGALGNGATGPAGRALLSGGEERFWTRSSHVVSALSVLGYATVGWRFGVLGFASVWAGGLILRNVWNLLFLHQRIVQGEAEEEEQAFVTTGQTKGSDTEPKE